MYYHFAILLLFRPLIKLRILGSKISPRDVCSQAADAMQGLLKSYSQLYTLRRTPSFVPYFVLASAIMHLAIGAAEAAGRPGEPVPEAVEDHIKHDDRISNAISQGIADLAEMAPCHQFAEQALHILRYLAKKWSININLDNGETPMLEGLNTIGRRSTSTLTSFAPDISTGDFLCQWGTSRATTSAAATPNTTREAAENIENPLFSPFPLQGRPVLPYGDNLRAAGFEIL